MSMLVQLDHLVDRLLCVDAKANILKQQYVEKAIRFIQLADDKKHGAITFGKVLKKEDPRMFGLDYTDYVKRGNRKIFFQLSIYYNNNASIGFKLFMTLGFFTMKYSTEVYDHRTDERNTANVRALLDTFK